MTYKTIRNAHIHKKTVIVRVDFDVPLDEHGEIVDDTRIKANIPTLEYLLKNKNKLILIAKLGRPKGKDPKLSLKPIAQALPEYLSGHTCSLIDDFLTENEETFQNQTRKNILLLENIRYFSDKTRSEPSFVKKLAQLGDVFVNDAFAMAHRDEPSTTGITQHLPSYAGLLLDTEAQIILKVIQKPRRPLVSIIGGAKIATKVEPIKKLLDISDHVLVGGGVANTFLKAHGYEIGRSLYDKGEVTHARKLLDYASTRPVNLEMPIDARVGSLSKPHTPSRVVSLPVLTEHGHILDIGPATEDIYAEIIAQAQTIIWNGPMGLIENEQFRRGTDAVYRSIVLNQHCYSVVGGGDTLAALHGKRQKHAIDHISTGGGAMLHLIEHEDLPALKALR